MFALRGLAITLSVFAIVYGLLSVLIYLTWHRVRELLGYGPIRRVAGILFALRMAPMIVAFLLAVFLAAPSFVLLEPRGIVEPIGAFFLALGVCGLTILIFGLVNTAVAFRKASRIISGWMSGAQRLPAAAPLPIMRAQGATPPMAAVGILHPRILFSDAAQLTLDSDELWSALNHEIAHVRSHDNLKKLLLQSVAIPGVRKMRELEEAWLEATEMAADYSAVSSISEALDLAAALIKLCRLGPPQPSSQLTVASFSHSSVEVVNKRIERLIHWAEEPSSTRKQFRWYGAGFALGLIAVVGISYSHLLMGIHLATEWLVR
jgi:Zn-dependent protease with chaperone function